MNALLSALADVFDYVAPCFPPSYNIFEQAQQHYHVRCAARARWAPPSPQPPWAWPSPQLPCAAVRQRWRCRVCAQAGTRFRPCTAQPRRGGRPAPDLAGMGQLAVWRDSHPGASASQSASQAATPCVRSATRAAFGPKASPAASPRQAPALHQHCGAPPTLPQLWCTRNWPCMCLGAWAKAGLRIFHFHFMLVSPRPVLWRPCWGRHMVKCQPSFSSTLPHARRCGWWPSRFARVMDIVGKDADLLSTKSILSLLQWVTQYQVGVMPRHPFTAPLRLCWGEFLSSQCTVGTHACPAACTGQVD
jgi:hypothetical protein